MKRRIVSFLLGSILIFSMIYSSTVMFTNEINAKINKKEEAKIKPKDLEIKTDFAITNDSSGQTVYCLTVKNKSKNIIGKMELKFKPKKGTTLDNFKDKITIEKGKPEPKNIDDFELRCRIDYFLQPDETSDETKLYFDGGENVEDIYEITNKDLTSLFDLSYIELAYVDGDNWKLEKIDISNDKVNINEEDTVPIYNLGKSNLYKEVPKPNFKYVSNQYDDDDYIHFFIFNVSKEDYNKYVDECKKAGFTENSDEKYGYKAVNSKNKDTSIEIKYYESEDTISVLVKKGE